MDAQKNEPLYGINEKALYTRIMSKKKRLTMLLIPVNCC